MSHYIITEKKNGLSYSFFSLIIYTLYLMVPFVAAYSPQILKYFIYVLSIFGVILGSFELERDEITQLAVTSAIIIFFSVISFFGIWKEKNSFFPYLLQRVLFWLGLIYYPYFRNVRQGEVKILGKILIVFLFATMVTTLIGNIQYPNASRELARATKETLYVRHNIGGYGFIYGLVVLLPYMIYIYKYQTGMLRTVGFAVSVLTVVVCVFSEYTLAVMIVIFEFLFEIGNKKMRKGKNIILLLMILVFFFLFRNHVAEFLLHIRDLSINRGLPSLAERIDNLRLMIMGNAPIDDAQTRFSQYTSSFTAFLKNPIVGNIDGTEHLGGHSEILDILGGTGLFGFSLFFILIAKHYNHIKDFIGTDYWGPSIHSLIIFIVIASVNTVLTSPFMGVCLFFGPQIIYSFIEERIETPIEKTGCKYIR